MIDAPQPSQHIPSVDSGAPPKMVPRTPPEVEPGRAELVKDWVQKIEEAKEFWNPKFKQMRRDAAFARGKQWPGQKEDDDRYRANITLRHINQRVASIYAKNPRVKAVRKPKLWLQVWDGSPEQLQAAQQSMQVAANPVGVAVQAAAQTMATGVMTPPPAPAMPPEEARAILAEAQDVMTQKRLYDRMGRTLEIVAQYYLDEPNPKFKTQAKQLVRRVLTTSVGYIKLGYQRQMEYGADVQTRMRDITDRLKQIEVLAQDLADREIQPDSKEAEELRLQLAVLQKQKDVLVREGLLFGFPKSWSIIVDPNVTQLKGFVGAEWIAEEYLFTPKQVQKIYGIDVGTSFNPYTPDGKPLGKKKRDQKYCAVYEVHDINSQTCFTVLSGWQDFLKEPSEPYVQIEQGHPYFALTFNDVEDDDECVMPPSDVELITPMQLDYNRAREGVRVHRQANRPASVAGRNIFDDESKDAFATHADHEIIEANIGKNDDIDKLLKPKPTVPITPELYDTEATFVDTQRVAGDQPANLGGLSGGTATESSIAENSRVTSIQSNIDDLDDFFTDVLRAAGQILLTEMAEETVKKIAGPAAVWPKLTRQDVAEELILDVKVGSSGRPNRQARLAAVEKTAPFLLQVPGVKPKKMAEFLLTEIDEGIEIEDFYDEGQPSIVAQNAMAKPNLAPAPGNEAQAPQGAANETGAPGAKGGGERNMYPAPGARGGGLTVQ
jgi:hypothetical protein